VAASLTRLLRGGDWLRTKANRLLSLRTVWRDGSAADVRRARSRRDQAQIGDADAARAQRIVGRRGVDDRQVTAFPLKLEHGALDRHGAAGLLDARLGIAAAPAPTGDRALRVGFDHADALAVVDRGNREPDRKCALAAAALLSCQHECVHLRRLSTANRGAPND
jgi:hypothetical protein